MKIKIDDFPPPSMSIGFDVLVGQCTSRRISLFYEFFWSLEHQSKRTFQKILHSFHIGHSLITTEIYHIIEWLFSHGKIYVHKCIFFLFIFEFSKKKKFVFGGGFSLFRDKPWNMKGFIHIHILYIWLLPTYTTHAYILPVKVN